jgi:uncharacterized protein (TIGR01244 family)
MPALVSMRRWRLRRAVGFHFLILWAAVSLLLSAFEIPDTVDPGLIVNYRRVHAGLATGGMISEQGLTQLKSFGFVTVLDIRTEREGIREEEAAVKAMGLRYVNVPVTPQTLGITEVEAVGRILADPRAAPVLFHCASANRVGGIWALVQLRRGKSLEEAEADGGRIGLKSPAMIKAVRRLAPIVRKPRQAR